MAKKLTAGMRRSIAASLRHDATFVGSATFRDPRFASKEAERADLVSRCRDAVALGVELSADLVRFLKHIDPTFQSSESNV